MSELQEILEYEVETKEGELVNCFTWAELRTYFNRCPRSTLRMSVQRGTMLLGQYRISKVKYLWEKGE